MTGLKKKLFTAACALFICAVLSACGISSPEPSKIGTVTRDETQGSTSDVKQSTATPKPTEAPLKDVYYVGDIVEVKGVKLVYTACGEYVSSNSFTKPNDGNKFVFLEFYAENVGTGTVSVSFIDFKGYADGYAVDQKYFSENAIGGSLSSGRWDFGRIYFEVPANASEIEAEYEYDMLKSKKLKFAYEGEKDSGFVPEAKTTPSENVFKPGDVIDAGKFRISYLSCDYFESDNRFIQPDEGNVFVYLELEFENTSDSDRSVNSLLFECYADGRVCQMTALRDDDLSASLSPGRKAKGTVAFQVPKDASVIEVEFKDSLFDSAKTVFGFEK